MNDLKCIKQMKLHGNVHTFEYSDKTIILYDDHRWILNVLFEASKINIFKNRIANIIYFDHHDDGISDGFLKKVDVSNLLEMSSRDFWTMVDFDIHPYDDTWVTAGMELGLIKDVVCIGQEVNNNILLWTNNSYIDHRGITHKGFCIKHIFEEIKDGGVFDKKLCVKPDIWDIFDYGEGGFKPGINTSFVLDFDLDCFASEKDGETRAWSEQQFKECYSNPDVDYFMGCLLDRASIITICREPECCGGIGESNKILGYLDKYFFEGCLRTGAI